MSEAASVSLQDQLLDLFLFLGPEWVLYLLLGLSVISATIAVERIYHFVYHRDDLSTLGLQLEQTLKSGGAAAARELMKQRRSHVAAIVMRGLGSLDRGAAAVEEVMASATIVERLKMERGLAFLGTLGNNAPFIGLFGTVLGVIRAFRDLSINSLAGSEAVMAGLAEALIATAVGLLVALPAVAVFNAFQRTIKSRLSASDAIARVLLAHAKANTSEG